MQTGHTFGSLLGARVGSAVLNQALLISTKEILRFVDLKVSDQACASLPQVRSPVNDLSVLVVCNELTESNTADEPERKLLTGKKKELQGHSDEQAML